MKSNPQCSIPLLPKFKVAKGNVYLYKDNDKQNIYSWLKSLFRSQNVNVYFDININTNINKFINMFTGVSV